MSARMPHRLLGAAVASVIALTAVAVIANEADAATRYRYVFPVVGRAGYAHRHSSYPASDIIAACGLPVVSPVDGVVLGVTRVDSWERGADPALRGGKSFSILGADGVRYYGSHLSRVNRGIRAGVKVRAGQRLGLVGRTGRAGACHLHFGISPACARTGDWWIRRGVVWPWRYLDSWRKKDASLHLSPRWEVRQWRRANGCPTRDQM